jgi:hypothetical protein
MSRAAKQTLSKIHKTVTCNADSSTYMTTSEHQWTLELCLPVKSLSLGLGILQLKKSEWLVGQKVFRED